ncbi:MAG: Stp1/IreP family PP2C-type Ser/Thr phosphatase [Ruminococcaceae bacterium]|nr:Stp1/IreP family PP2C-type Ser/Thr phosphatase [Oscillospiraceae bacterium]
MRIYSKIDIGKERTLNQDAFFAGEISQDIAFAVVCDGMGGANAGDVASQTAVKTISEYIINSYRRKITIRDFVKILKNAIISANITLYDMASKDDALKGMGTTVVVAVVKENEVAIAHVGDSRIYLVNDEITQLTRDHSIVQTLIESGEISPEAAARHPRKNVITRALGVEADVAVDTAELILQENESLLLCTDGLTNFVTVEDILKTFKENDTAIVPEKLVELANAGGGGDNITAVTLTK